MGPDDIINDTEIHSLQYCTKPANLFNTSLPEGRLPSQWKLARVVPVPKLYAQKYSVSGYLQANLNSSKILEHHVRDVNIILDRICQAYPISDRQWGFMHFHSSTSALISDINDCFSALDNGQEVCVVFFDVQNAFDSVPHLPLLQKLEQIGAIKPYHDLEIGTQLSNRKRAVCCG